MESPQQKFERIARDIESEFDRLNSNPILKKQVVDEMPEITLIERPIKAVILDLESWCRPRRIGFLD